MLTIRSAKMEEFNKVMSFYHDLIDAMQDAESKPGWKKDVYPTALLIRETIKNQDLYVGTIDDDFAGAMIMNHSCADGYANAPWQIKAKDEDVMVIHTLGITHSYQGKGLAKQMISSAIEICKNRSIKAIRLDVLATNFPATQCYLSMGFRYTATIELFYEDVGLTDFDLYELLL